MVNRALLVRGHLDAPPSATISSPLTSLSLRTGHAAPAEIFCETIHAQEHHHPDASSRLSLARE
jgi:hypothetical protein